MDDNDVDKSAGHHHFTLPPSQAKLTNLAIQIGYGGMAISLVTVIILSIRFSVDKFYYEVAHCL